MSETPVSVVTGASQGLGRVIALRLAAKGHRVVLASRNTAKLREAKDLIETAGGCALLAEVDVTDRESVATMARVAEERWGRIDHVVANSGIAGPSKPLWEVSVDEWRETLDVNVTGVASTLAATLPGMIERRSGNAVVIGSASGKRPLRNRTPYTASKMALVGLVRTLAVEAGAHGVRVNLVSPGFITGERMEWVIRRQAEVRGISIPQMASELENESPLQRMTAPDEVADAVSFLLSDAASGITGADVNVNVGVAMY